MSRIFKPILYAIATVYFVVDALFLLVSRPISRWLSRIGILKRFRTWILSLSPYATLALFAIPLIVLEPLKPAALYLIATRHFMTGLGLLIAGELLKLIFIERLIELSKDKLMSIPAFAWVFNHGKAILDWLQITRAWRLAKSWRDRIKLYAERVFTRWRKRAVRT